MPDTDEEKAALDVETVDLADLAVALEDHSADHRWWLDPDTGEVEPRFGPASSENGTYGLVSIEPLPSSVGYSDMEEFISRVRDPRARYLLEQAISGKGAFRRFKDALVELPELRRAWFAFHDARGERRAIDWLAEHGLVEPEAAEEARERRPEPGSESLPGVLDAHGIIRRLGAELGRLYAGRLKDIVLIGAWARGSTHPESPIELLVVLEGASDPWQEKSRMDRIVWRHSIRHDAVITVLPVVATDLERTPTPLLARVASEGIPIR